MALRHLVKQRGFIGKVIEIWRISSVYLFALAFAALFVCAPFADFRTSGASQIAFINLWSTKAEVARIRRCAAKEGGRNQVRTWKKGMHKKSS